MLSNEFKKTRIKNLLFVFVPSGIILDIINSVQIIILVIAS